MKNLKIKISKRYNTYTLTYKGYSKSKELLPTTNINGTKEDFINFIFSKIVDVKEDERVINEGGNMYLVKSFIFLANNGNTMDFIEKSRELI